MTTEDQIVALFAKANPVPSLDLLDPIEPVDLGHLTDPSERSGAMTELKTDETKEVRRPRRRLVPALATLAFLLVAIPIVLNSQTFLGRPATPIEVADAYMEALVGHEGGVAMDLFAPDGIYNADLANAQDPAVLVGQVAHDRAIGLEYTNQGCAEDSIGTLGTKVLCTFTIQSEHGRVLDLEPSTGDVEILVEDGQIRRTIESWDNQRVVREAWLTFRAWIDENHPDDVETMYETVDWPSFDSESIALWQQYTEEFVASFEG